jgi:hypothetical protein
MSAAFAAFRLMTAGRWRSATVSALASSSAGAHSNKSAEGRRGGQPRNRPLRLRVIPPGCLGACYD